MIVTHDPQVRQVALGFPLPRVVWAIAVVFSLVGASQSAVGGDWPDILGPQRNGTASGEMLPNAWPKAGPKTVWVRRAGSGFAGPTVVGDKVVLFHRVGDVERIEALSAAASGETLWTADFPASYRGTINPDDGPRAVPVVHDGAVYALGAAGDLYCVALFDGATLDPRLWADYKAQEGYFGASGTPIVMGDRLLVNVGGRDGAGLVAVGLKDGKTIWKATDEHASYSSPTRARIGGSERAVFVTRLSAMLVDPANGHVDAQIPFGQRGPTVNAATPLVAGDALFLTASYSIGARMLRVSPDGFEEIWSSDDVLSSQYNTPVYADGRLYGIHGREDVGVAALRCVEAATGKVRWSVDDFGVAHVLLAGDKLLLAKIDGQLVLAQASPEKFQPLARHAAFDGTLRAIPALSGGKLLARDDNELKCIDVSAGP